MRRSCSRLARLRPSLEVSWRTLEPTLPRAGLGEADAKLPLSAMTALAALCGLVHGYLNGTGMGQSGFAVVTLLGLTSGVFVLILLAAAFVVQLQANWARIAVRVAGSWIAASGLLMLGWSFRGS
jgi:urease accessory protein